MAKFPTAAEVEHEVEAHDNLGFHRAAELLDVLATLLRSMEGQDGTPMINKIADDFYNAKINWTEAVEQARQVERLVSAIREQTIEECELIAMNEAKYRIQRSAGDASGKMAQGHKAVTANFIAGRIGALKEKKA